MSQTSYETDFKAYCMSSPGLPAMQRVDYSPYWLESEDLLLDERCIAVDIYNTNTTISITNLKQRSRCSQNQKLQVLATSP
ncbi:hypothetical protein WAI453_005683 [Rhynchosporium graminicola]